MTEDKQVDQGRAEVGEVDTTGADEVDTAGAEKMDPGRVEEVATVRQVEVDCPVDEEWTEKVM